MLISACLLGTVVVCFVTLVGPWPTYGSGFADASYYQKAVAAIDRHDTRVSHDLNNVGRFQAGWATRSMTPPQGTPLAGYGGRKGKPSTGVHDEIYVKALAISDGQDTAVIVGSDLLIVPENVADRVRARVSQQTTLTANDILFNASHNHSGPGAFGPGLASRLFNGPYDPQIPTLLSTAFTEAIVAPLPLHAALILIVFGITPKPSVRVIGIRALCRTGNCCRQAKMTTAPTYSPTSSSIL